MPRFLGRPVCTLSNTPVSLIALPGLQPLHWASSSFRDTPRVWNAPGEISRVLTNSASLEWRRSKPSFFLGLCPFYNSRFTLSPSALLGTLSPRSCLGEDAPRQSLCRFACTRGGLSEKLHGFLCRISSLLGGCVPIIGRLIFPKVFAVLRVGVCYKLVREELQISGTRIRISEACK